MVTIYIQRRYLCYFWGTSLEMALGVKKNCFTNYTDRALEGALGEHAERINAVWQVQLASESFPGFTTKLARKNGNYQDAKTGLIFTFCDKLDAVIRGRPWAIYAKVEYIGEHNHDD